MGYLYTLLTIILWAVSSGLLVKSINISPFALYSIGAFFGIIFLLIILIVKRDLNNLFKYPRKMLFLMLGVGILNALNNGIYYVALKSGLIANAILGHYLSSVIIVAIVAPIFLKEKMKLKTLVLSTFGFIGLIILTIPQLGKAKDVALYFGALSAFFYALQTVYVKKVSLKTTNHLGAIIYNHLVPCLLFAPYALDTISKGMASINWFFIILWGVFALGVAYIFWFKGLKLIPAGHAAILSYGEPILAIILSTIFLKQPLSIYTIIGGSLIIGSGIAIIKK